MSPKDNKEVPNRIADTEPMSKRAAPAPTPEDAAPAPAPRWGFEFRFPDVTAASLGRELERRLLANESEHVELSDDPDAAAAPAELPPHAKRAHTALVALAAAFGKRHGNRPVLLRGEQAEDGRVQVTVHAPAVDGDGRPCNDNNGRAVKGSIASATVVDATLPPAPVLPPDPDMPARGSLTKQITAALGR